jgi:anti-sigma28 factor (negative regulator of flagellin synthesis)
MNIITPAGIFNKGIQTYGDQGVQAAKKAGADGKKNSRMQPDEVILSNDGVELCDTVRRINQISPRVGLVKELREQIKAGEYQVDSRDLAEKIIEASKGGL